MRGGADSLIVAWCLESTDPLPELSADRIVGAHGWQQQRTVVFNPSEGICAVQPSEDQPRRLMYADSYRGLSHNS